MGKIGIVEGNKLKDKAWREIQIQTSNWIPRPATFRPICVPSLPTEAKVSEFILLNQ